MPCVQHMIFLTALHFMSTIRDFKCSAQGSMTYHGHYGIQVQFESEKRRITRRISKPTIFTHFVHDVVKLCGLSPCELQGHTVSLQAWDGQVPHESFTLAHTDRIGKMFVCLQILRVFPSVYALPLPCMGAGGV